MDQCVDGTLHDPPGPRNGGLGVEFAVAGYDRGCRVRSGRFCALWCSMADKARAQQPARLAPGSRRLLAPNQPCDDSLELVLGRIPSTDDSLLVEDEHGRKDGDA